MSDSSQTYSVPGNQHVLNGARNTTIGQAVFNNAGRDLYHNNSKFDSNPLWDAIADVGASHDSEQQVDRGRCLPGTREAVLEIIRQWRDSGCESMPVCWLSGAVGVGKSAIALTVAEECEKDGLVASFFFFKSDPKRNNPSFLILSIAHGLVVTRPYLGPFINQRITTNPRVLKVNLEDQYKKLILENLDHPPPPCDQKIPDLVIIDGLDECSDAAAQCRVLSIIFSTYSKQPLHSPLRYLICSRPESWIRQEFCQFNRLTKHIELNDSFHPQYDIEVYFHQQFQEIRRDPNYSEVEFPDPWPSFYYVQLLIDKADGQFIYASTVIKFIKAAYTLPTDQLHIILETISKSPSIPSAQTQTPFSDLDELYLIILHVNPDCNKRLLPILAVIIVVQNTSPAFIELLLGNSPGTVAQTLRAMHSVLNVCGREDDIGIYHKSFTEFLLDQTRSREFFIDKLMWKDFLALQWTRVLTEHCKKDPGLLSRDHQYSTESLWKLVHHWKNHCLPLVDGHTSIELMVEVDAFFHVALSISVQSVGYEVLLHVLAVIILVPNSSPEFIGLILGHSPGTVVKMLCGMHSVFDVHDFDISIYHKSFTDFLLNHAQSKGFFINESMKDFLACQWTRALTEQCRKVPELLRDSRYFPDPLWKLVQCWRGHCLPQGMGGHMSDALMLELEEFYYVALSISAESVGHEMLLHILAAFLLLPLGEPRSPDFIQLLLGLHNKDLALASQTLNSITQVEWLIDSDYFLDGFTFEHFFFDRSWSNSFFIEKDCQRNFLAQKCLCLFQMDKGPQDKILINNWARICTNVDNPTQELLYGLHCMDLGGVLAKSLNCLHYLPCDFDTILSWLKSQANGVVPPDLIDCFEIVQRGFHIQSKRQEIKSGFHDHVITMIVLSIVDWDYCIQHLSQGLNSCIYYLSQKLVKIKFCRCSSLSTFDSNCASTPISNTTDLYEYHINIRASCAQIFKAAIAGLQWAFETYSVEEYYNLVDRLLVQSPSLLTHCLPVPELLLHFRTLLDFAMTLGRGDLYHQWVESKSPVLEESQGKLLSWLESFPADCAHQVETVRCDFLSLMTLGE
ncbi:hypothetical protein E1B28_001824 [Marasmius oreades]|uniref:Nephrocystin 3-like N-terminal domain-containing protein n=1 Tax=Marasmius oreades TaxID=181124 RepID=A0A9P7V4C8_9AGAR|nr:uncharacterized protein E1B28_001824 [Marasmius oreades]KAG7100038.1 hypothetical protein E1B28_001824 [Marasmius oreades]